MGAWDWIKENAGKAYNAYDKYLAGGLLPGGEDPSDPSRTGGQYEGVDRGNFDLPGYQGMQDRYGGYLAGVDSRSAPTIGPYERAQASGFRGDQSNLINLMMGRAQGKNSVADLQYQRGAELADQQQRSIMAGARPQNAAMAMRVGSQNIANNQMDLTGGAALARAQEANMAANGLGNILAQGRGADENLGMFNAGQGNQRQLAQAQMNQQQYGIDDSARANLLGQSLQTAGLQQQGGMGYEQNRTQRFGSVLGVPTNLETTMGMAGGLIKGALGGG